MNKRLKHTVKTEKFVYFIFKYGGTINAAEPQGCRRKVQVLSEVASLH